MIHLGQKIVFKVMMFKEIDPSTPVLRANDQFIYDRYMAFNNRLPLPLYKHIRSANEVFFKNFDIYLHKFLLFVYFYLTGDRVSSSTWG